MLPHPTHDRLIALGLLGMAKAFEEQRQQPAVASLTFEERLGLLVDREAVEREREGGFVRIDVDCEEPVGRPCLGARGAELHEQFLAIEFHGGESLEARP